MHLVRDLLDKRVVDRNGRDMGRVDRIVIERGGGLPPRVTAIEIGPSALAERLGRLPGRWITALLQHIGVQDEPLRVRVSQILAVSDRVKVDLAFGQTSAASIEYRLRRFVKRLPGANR